jgi:hypothetical protein
MRLVAGLASLPLCSYVMVAFSGAYHIETDATRAKWGDN